MKTGINVLIVINKDKDIKDITYKQIEENFLRTLKKANVLVD